MPFQVKSYERKTFTLDRTDEEFGNNGSATTVTIIQARVRQNTERSDIFSEWIREMRADGNDRVIYKLPTYRLTLKEIYLVLVDCNILGPGDKPLFRFKSRPNGERYLDMGESDFYAAAGVLPDEVIAEIHEKVLEVNPHWVFGSEPEGTDLGEESSPEDSPS